MGATWDDGEQEQDPLTFQSTRPRWARRERPARAGSARCFNPRARDGRDMTADEREYVSSVFQSTRPRWARPYASSTVIPEDAFQSTRPRWARQVQHIYLMAKGNFVRICEATTLTQEFAAVPCCDCGKSVGQPVFTAVANLAVKHRPLDVRGGCQKTKGPLRSSAALAPTCSTRCCQFLPR